MHDGGEFSSYQSGKSGFGHSVITGNARQDIDNHSEWQRGRRDAANEANSPFAPGSFSGGGGGPFVLLSIVELIAVACLVGFFSNLYIWDRVGQLTSSYAWVIFADIVSGIAAAALYMGVQVWLLTNPVFGVPTLYACTVLWAYLGYLWARGDGPFGLAAWSAAAAALAYIDKVMMTDLYSGRDFIGNVDAGGLVLIETPLMTFAGIYFLLAAHVSALPAIGATLGAVFVYKMLLPKLDRTFLVYPIVAASVAIWVFLAYLVSHGWFGLDEMWQLGAMAVVGCIAFLDKRTLLKTYGAAQVLTKQKKQARAVERSLVKCPSCPQYNSVSANGPQLVICAKCGTNFTWTAKTAGA